MRILFVNSIQMFGGGEVWMLRSMQKLQKRGHTVQLACRPDTELYAKAKNRNVKVHSIRFRGDFDPVTIIHFWRLLGREKIDIILTNMDKELRIAGMAARMNRACAVIPRRGIDYPLKNKLHYRFSYTKLADAIIANSKSTKRALLKNAPWLPQERVRVIYNGIDPQRFLLKSSQRLRKMLSLQQSDALIGFVGQLDERKGLTTLLQAFHTVNREIPNAHLVLVGKGPLKAEIERFAQKNQLVGRLHMPGFLEDIVDVMHSIDLLVLPSWWEGFGIVLIEAMAAAKPCITTNVSSMPEIVIDQSTGRVVAVNDEEALSRAIYTVIAQPRLAKKWGENGRHRVLTTFHIDTMIDQLEDLFYSQLRYSRKEA